MANSNSSKRIQLIISILISLVCLGAIFFFVDPIEILRTSSEANLGLWLLAATCIVVFMAFRAIRWKFMLDAGQRKNPGIPYRSVFHIQNIGYLLTNILPFRLGDVARAVLIGNVPPITISKGLSTMVSERVLDLLFIVALFPFVTNGASEIPYEIRLAAQAAAILAVVAFLVLIGAANQRKFAIQVASNIFNRFSLPNSASWIRRLDDLLLGLSVFTNLLDGLILIILSVVVWLPIIAGYYFGLRGVNLDVSIIEAAFIVCIAAFTLSIPSSPGGFGTQEAAVIFVTSALLGYPEDSAASFAFLYRLANYGVLGLLGIIGINQTGETFGSVMASARSLVKGSPKQ